VDPRDVATPLRELVGQQPNVHVLLGEVSRADARDRKVIFNDRACPYDQI